MKLLAQLKSSWPVLVATAIVLSGPSYFMHNHQMLYFLFILLGSPFFYVWLDKPLVDAKEKIFELEADLWYWENYGKAPITSKLSDSLKASGCS